MPGFIIASTVVVLPPIACVGIVEWARIRGVDPTPYKPTWWLERDLTCSRTLQARALAELTDRLSADHLTAAQIEIVVDQSLAAQASGAAWTANWGVFIEAAHATGRLDAGRWAAYARQSVSISLACFDENPTHLGRPEQTDLGHARQGQSMFIQLCPFPCRYDRLTFRALYRLSDFRIDGRPIGTNRGFGSPPTQLELAELCMPLSAGASVHVTHPVPVIKAGQMSGVAVGWHNAEVTVRIYVYAASDIRPGFFAPFQLPTQRMVTQFDMRATGRFLVWAPPPVSATPDESAAMTKSIRDVSASLVGWSAPYRFRPISIVVHGTVVHSPRRTMFRVSVRQRDQNGPEPEIFSSLLSGYYLGAADTSGEFRLEGTEALRLFIDSPYGVDLYLKPDPMADTQNTDLSPIYGDVIQIACIRLDREVIPPKKSRLVQRLKVDN